MKLKLYLVKHLIQVKHKGKTKLCNGLLIKDPEENILRICVSTCYNPLRTLEILLHELLHATSYQLIRNPETREKIDTTIDKHIRIPANSH